MGTDKMTTVKDLRKLLEEYPDDMRVIIRGYEGGFNDVRGIKTVEIKLNVHESWWMGKHDEPSHGEAADEKALLI